MKTVKRLLSTMLIVILLLTAAPLDGLVGIELPHLDFGLKASAATYESGIFKYTLNKNNEATITGSIFTKVEELVGHLDVPSSIDGYPVITVGGFSKFKYLTSVSIADGVSTISSSAFKETAVSSVDLGTVSRIESSAFLGCPIASVDLTNVTSLGNGAFGNTNITYVSIPITLTSIGLGGNGGPFYGSALSSYTLEGNPSSIKEGLFAGCTQLHTIDIPDNITTIEAAAYYKCSGLTRITGMKKVTKIGALAFAFCSSLEQLPNMESLTTIGGCAFYNTTSLTDIFIPGTLKTVNADYSVVGIGMSEITGGYGAFLKSGLKNVTFSSSLKTIPSRLFFNCSSLEEINIPSSITQIEAAAFYKCIGLQKVTGATNVTTIGQLAFGYCSSLKEFPALSKLQSLGGAAFYYDSALTDFFIPKSLTKCGFDYNVVGIGTKYNTGIFAFSGLKNVAFDDAITSIPEALFFGCTTLEKIQLPDSIVSVQNLAFYGCANLTDVFGFELIENFGALSFCNCKALTVLPFSDQIKTIKSGAFANTTGVKEITMPRSLTSISTSYSIVGLGSGTAYPFQGSGVERIKITDGTSSIKAGLFYKCQSLKDVYIPSSVKSVGKAAFDLCKNLSDVYYTGSKQQWGAITIAASNDPLLNANIHYNYLDLQLKPGQYAIRVVNSNGDPITNATIAVFDATNTITDEDIYSVNDKGIAIIEKGSVGQLNYNVTADGYEEYTTVGTNYSFNDAGYDIVVLYTKEESKLKLEYATYRDLGSLYLQDIDITKKTKRLSCTNSDILFGTVDVGHFRLMCRTRGIGAAVNYQLWQNDTLISEKVNGDFEQKIADFQPGKGVYVRAIGVDGSQVDTPINLEILVDNNFEKWSVDFGKSLTFTIPSSVPYFGDSTLAIDLPTLPIQFHFENGKVYVGLNLNLNPEEVDKKYEGKPFKKFWDDLKDSQSDLSKISKYNVKKDKRHIEKIEKFLDKKEKFNLPAAGKVDAIFFGGAEFDYSDFKKNGLDQISFNMYILVDASVKKSWQTAVSVVPVVISLKGGVKVKTETKGSYSIKNNILNGDITVDITPYFSAFAGAGVGEIVGVGVYGDATVPIKIQLAGSSASKGLQSVDLTGELGIKAYALIFEYKKTFAYNTWHLYTRTRALNAPSKSISLDSSDNESDSLYDLDNYSVSDLSYLQEESNWLVDESITDTSSPKRVKSASATAVNKSEIKSLITDTYRNAQPIIASSSSNAVMAYLAADTERGIYNATKVMYSVYNASKSTWGTPIQADNNNTLDSSPYLYSDGTDIWLCYAESNQEFNDDAALSGILNSQRITVYKFNNSTKKFVLQTTFDSPVGYNRTPQVTTIDGVPYVVWISSTNADIFGQGASSILCSKLDNGAWSTPETLVPASNTITQFTCGEINGQFTCAFSIDKDNLLSTEDDQFLCFANEAGIVESTITGARNLTFSEVPTADEVGFIYTCGNSIKMTEDGTSVVDICELGESPESVVVLDNRILFTLADNSASQVYSSSYDVGADCWGTPVVVTEQDKYIENLTATIFNGQILASMTRKAVTITEDSVEDKCELSWAKINDSAEITIDEVYIDQRTVEPNQTVSTIIGITNTGTNAIDAFTITVRDQDGNEMYSQLIDDGVVSGESKEFVIDLPMKENISLETWSVSISTDLDGFSSNSYDFSVGYADLVPSIEVIKIGNLNTAVVTVKNEGASTASGAVEIYRDSNKEETLQSYSIRDLGSNEQVVFFFDVEDVTKSEDIIYATTFVTEDEYFTENNTSFEYMDLSKRGTAVPLSEINIQDTQTEMSVGETIQLEAKLIPANTTEKGVVWQSSDDSIATVSDVGLVSAHSTGDVLITATGANGISDTVLIHVKEKEYTITWIIDEKEIVANLTAGTQINPPIAQKDGYRFISWDSNVPERMPAWDLMFTAVFEPIVHTHSFTLTETKQPNCTEPGIKTYSCTCGYSYAESIPTTDHFDNDNDGYCDMCNNMMEGDDHCVYCGKIHEGIFGWLVKFFHRILAIFKK